MSVKRLLDSAKHLVTATLQRLALPAFGEGIVGTPEPIIVPVDLRSVDRRRNRETRPTDTPQHYAEWRTPGFIAAVKSLRPYVGKNSGLSGAARALLGTAIVRGQLAWLDSAQRSADRDAAARARAPSRR